VKKDPLEKIYKKLRMAYAKILVAENIKRNRKNSMKTLYVLAITGNIFTTPDFLAGVYISSTLSDIKKVRKMLGKALKKEELPPETRLLLEQLNSVLETDKKASIYDLKMKLAEALKILESGAFYDIIA